MKSITSSSSSSTADNPWHSLQRKRCSEAQQSQMDSADLTLGHGTFAAVPPVSRILPAYIKPTWFWITFAKCLLYPYAVGWFSSQESGSWSQSRQIISSLRLNSASHPPKKKDFFFLNKWSAKCSSDKDATTLASVLITESSLSLR